MRKLAIAATGIAVSAIAVGVAWPSSAQPVQTHHKRPPVTRTATASAPVTTAAPVAAPAPAPTTTTAPVAHPAPVAAVHPQTVAAAPAPPPVAPALSPAAPAPPVDVPVTSASMTFTVPDATCPAYTAFGSVWVGIDDTAGELAQPGAELSCYNSQYTATAFWEVYPGPVQMTSVVLNPGDQVQASVTANGGTYTMSVADLTTGGTVSTTQPAQSSTTLDGECMVEDHDPHVPYASVSITGCTVNGQVVTSGQAIADDGETLSPIVGGSFTVGQDDSQATGLTGYRVLST